MPVVDELYIFECCIEIERRRRRRHRRSVILLPRAAAAAGGACAYVCRREEFPNTWNFHFLFRSTFRFSFGVQNEL